MHEPVAPPPQPGPGYGPPPTPSGLFPSGPARPTYREPYPVRGAAVAAGIGGAVVWLLVFGLLGGQLATYAWWTIFAGLVAWLIAVLLAWAGDRGVAVGIAIATALGWAIAATAVAVRWATTENWPLW